jgi:uncharacterized protein (TIGR00290 family)
MPASESPPPAASPASHDAGAPRGEPIVLSWSGGKDSALALARLRDDPSTEVVRLLTTVTAGYDHVSIHGVRRTLLHRQAEALGVELHEVWIEPQSSDRAYRAAMATSLAELRSALPDLRRVAFGDLFLADVRAYREALVAECGWEACFPLWGEPTGEVARRVIRDGFVARLVCVDTEVLPIAFAGRGYDAALLEALPPGVDPCGERGEFHTFVADGPGFRHAVDYEVGRTELRDGRFAFSDLLPPRRPRGCPRPR